MSKHHRPDEPTGYITLFQGDIHAPSLNLLTRVLDALHRL